MMSRRNYHIKINLIAIFFVLAYTVGMELISYYYVADKDVNYMKTTLIAIMLCVFVCSSIYYVKYKQTFDNIIFIGIVVCAFAFIDSGWKYCEGYYTQKDTINLFLTNCADRYKDNGIDVPDKVNIINYLPTWNTVTVTMLEDVTGYAALAKVNEDVELPAGYYNEELREKIDVIEIAENLASDGEVSNDISKQISTLYRPIEDVLRGLVNLVYPILFIILSSFLKLFGKHVTTKNGETIIDTVYNKKYGKEKPDV